MTYRGEKFAAILPNTPSVGAMQIAEEIRAAVRALEILHERSLVSQFVTLSLDVASTIPIHDTNPTTLIAAADSLIKRKHKVAISAV